MHAIVNVVVAAAIVSTASLVPDQAATRLSAQEVQTIQELQIVPTVDVTKEGRQWMDSVRDSARPIRSLTSDDFSDLAFLARALDGKRLVHLGESSHGVAEYNQLKVRLVKYLHRQLGFNVVALEGPLWACWDADRTARELSPEQFMRACVHPIWHTRENLELFRYVKATKATASPLTIIGFDNQPAPGLERAAWLRKVLAPISPELADTVAKADSAFLAQYRVGKGVAAAIESGNELLALYRRAEDAVRSSPDRIADGVAFTVQVIRSAGAHIRQLQTRGDKTATTAARDSAMAENIALLLERDREARIVTWGHNYHLRHANSAVRRADTGESLPRTTGEMLAERYAQLTYTIGFYMGTGQLKLVSGRTSTVKPLAETHAETLLMHTGYRYAAFELSTADKVDAVWGRELTFRWEGAVDIEMVPNQQYDLLVYFHEVHPAVSLRPSG